MLRASLLGHAVMDCVEKEAACLSVYTASCIAQRLGGNRRQRPAAGPARPAVLLVHLAHAPANLLTDLSLKMFMS